MPTIAIIFGILLDILGIFSFIITGSSHFTALIPTFIGSIIFLCGVLALSKPEIRKHAMHVAAVLGLVGTLGGLGRALPKIGGAIHGTGQISLAFWASLIMGLISLVFLVLCVRSFVNARLLQKTNTQA